MRQESHLNKILNEALEIIHTQRNETKTSIFAGAERYQMYKDWYDRLDDIRLEMAGVLGFEYTNKEVE